MSSNTPSWKTVSSRTISQLDNVPHDLGQGGNFYGVVLQDEHRLLEGQSSSGVARSLLEMPASNTLIFWKTSSPAEMV